MINEGVYIQNYLNCISTFFCCRCCRRRCYNFGDERKMTNASLVSYAFSLYNRYIISRRYLNPLSKYSRLKCSRVYGFTYALFSLSRRTAKSDVTHQFSPDFQHNNKPQALDKNTSHTNAQDFLGRLDLTQRFMLKPFCSLV